MNWSINFDLGDESSSLTIVTDAFLSEKPDYNDSRYVHAKNNLFFHLGGVVFGLVNSSETYAKWYFH